MSTPPIHEQQLDEIYLAIILYGRDNFRLLLTAHDCRSVTPISSGALDSWLVDVWVPSPPNPHPSHVHAVVIKPQADIRSTRVDSWDEVP